jgi:endonuclease YncB( thermonuclease family)
MAKFIVSEVIDGDTFKVEGQWTWKMRDGKNAQGDTVRPIGYNTPEYWQKGYLQAKEKLTKLIEGKEIELKNAVTLSFGRLVCDVYYKGKNLASYFPEYQ